MSDQNKPQNENEQNKTVIFNSGSDRKKSMQDDQTKIEQTKPTGGESGASASTTSTTNEPPKESGSASAGPTAADLKSASKEENNGVSAGLFAAGVAGAAAAGVVAGTVYSDEIKGVFEASTYDAPESPEEEIQDATELATEADAGGALVNNQIADTAAEVDSVTDGSSHFSYQFSDQNGVYEVTMIDQDSDGNIDTISGEAQMVDGSSVSFTAAGDTLHSFFANDQVELAEPYDYVSYCTNNVFEGFGPESLGADSYHIQPGDTLSEIAAANNTSIGDLMALNPHITDANEIYAGDDIMIPIGDSDTNPYAGWTPNEAEVGIEYGEEIVTAGVDFNSQQDEFSEIDWQSFEDQPVEEYSSAFNETDFASMEMPDSYLDNSNDLDSLGFI